MSTVMMPSSVTEKTATLIKGVAELRSVYEMNNMTDEQLKAIEDLPMSFVIALYRAGVELLSE